MANKGRKSTQSRAQGWTSLIEAVTGLVWAVIILFVAINLVL